MSDRSAATGEVMRERAATCLHLATSLTDEEAADHLRLLAAEYLDLARKAELRRVRGTVGLDPDVLHSANT